MAALCFFRWLYHVRFPYSPLHLIIFSALLIVLVAVVQVGAITIAFGKLGLSPDGAFILLFGSLAGSAINFPLFYVDSHPIPKILEVTQKARGLLRIPELRRAGKTLVAVNVGGCIIPLLFSGLLLLRTSVTLPTVVLGVAVVTLVSRLASRPIAGHGIGIPILIAPITAAIVALSLDAQNSAALAYISGTTGVLLGADILRLGDIRRLGVSIAAVGGAGTFDGIFLTGILAALLA